MALFGTLSEKISHAFSKLRHRSALTELEIKNAMREVRIALLEADVNYLVVKNFANRVTERATGENILRGLDASQQVIKIVNEELIELMGSTHCRLQFGDAPPAKFVLCGLQGSGKTTMCGKLAAMLKRQGKKPLLIACDTYRPAAIEQLRVVGAKVGVPVFEMGQADPVKIAEQGVKFAKQNGFDCAIVDTAGRLHVDKELMKELKNIKKAIDPTETLLVADAMLGQDSVNVATAFNADLDITGVILTKLDGDARGGAALSIKAVTGKPIKFCGAGEKMTELEAFHPDRMASRILGMGDVLTLIEKAEQTITEEDAKKMTKKLRENSFDLNDYLDQISRVKKMGGLSGVLNMIPGMSQRLRGMESGIDEKQIDRIRAIIQSMTPGERERPEILNASRRRRIAAGSGSTIQDVNKLVNQFAQTKSMMKKLNSGKLRLPFGFK